MRSGCDSDIYYILGCQPISSGQQQQQQQQHHHPSHPNEHPSIPDLVVFGLLVNDFGSFKHTHHGETTTERKGLVMGQTPSSGFPIYHMEAHTVIKALEYISQKLCRKGIHVHLIVAGDALSCLLFKSRPTTHSISILQASALSPRSVSVLFDAVHRAQKKFGLANDWVNTDLSRQVDSDYLDYVVHKSLLQNEIVFSSEGLTLVAVDLCFALKSKLESLTNAFTQKDIEDAVVLLRRLVVIYRGRPLTKGYIRMSYPRMEVSDQILLRLNELYEWQYRTRGVAGVHDEYMEWRREGIVDWSFGIEDLKREVSACAPLEKGLYSWRDKPLPDTPYREDFAEIFTQQKVY